MIPKWERGVAALGDLRPAPYNPRRISPSAQAALQRSLERFGTVQEIVVNRRSGTIVGGHQRVAALRAAGETEAPVVWVDLGPAEERALNVTLNSSLLAGEYDETALEEILAGIREVLPDAIAELRLDELIESTSPDAPVGSQEVGEDADSESADDDSDTAAAIGDWSQAALLAPFPWFGGKRRVAGLVWSRFGEVANYVEPFFGSGAVLLGRPNEPTIETVNDMDGYVANFWRAIKRSPEEVAQYAEWPVNENDLHARHAWLVAQQDTLRAQLEGDPEWCDAKIAGWWVWGMACWIGGGFCSGRGPWAVVEGRLVHRGDTGRGVNRKRVHLGNTGQGVTRKLVHLGNTGRGVTRKLVHLGDAGDAGVETWFNALATRLARVRVCSGDWSRAVTPAVTWCHGVTAVFLDPPYADTADRDPKLYRCESTTVAHAVMDWAVEAGTRPDMRIALCGYQGEHTMPDSWECVAWSAQGGMGNQGRNQGSNANRHRERIWFSPACLRPQDPSRAREDE